MGGRHPVSPASFLASRELSAAGGAGHGGSTAYTCIRSEGGERTRPVSRAEGSNLAIRMENAGREPSPTQPLSQHRNPGLKLRSKHFTLTPWHCTATHCACLDASGGIHRHLVGRYKSGQQSEAERRFNPTNVFGVAYPPLPAGPVRLSHQGGMITPAQRRLASGSGHTHAVRPNRRDLNERPHFPTQT